jgi:hypothetical protein
MSSKVVKGLSGASADAAIRHTKGSANLIEAKTLRKRTRVKIGGVYVTGDKASAEEVKQAIAKSTDMLDRLGKKISKPGVRLRTARGVPLFSADPVRPDRLLRRLNGKTERGVLENGVFRVTD